MFAELATFMLDLVVRATVLLLAAMLLSWLLRRAPAAARHAIWALTLLGLLLLPALAILPRWDLPILPAAEAATSTAPPTTLAPAEWPPATALPDVGEPPAVADNLDTIAHADADADAAPTPASGPHETGTETTPAARTMISWVGSVACLWLLGTALLAWRLFRSLRCAAGLVERAAPVADHATRQAFADAHRTSNIRRQVRLCQSDEVAGPLTWGVLRPAVLLPADARTWSEPQLRTVLLHELSHVRRMDCGVQVLASLALALFWFHPLAWLANRKLHLEQERACDDAVLSSGCKASDYAGLLIRAAQRCGEAQPALVAAVMTSPSELMSRMTYMLDGRQRHGRLSHLACLALAGPAVATVAGLGVLQPAERAATPTEVRKPQDPKKQDPKKQDPEKQAQARRLIGMLDLASHRQVTVNELVKLGAPAIPHLVAVLDHKDEAVVIAAAQALGRMLKYPDQAVPPLVRMTGDKRDQVVQHAIKALSHFADRNGVAMDALVGMLNHENPTVVRAAIQRLVRQHTQQERIATALIAKLAAKDLAVVADAAANLAKMTSQLQLVMPALIAKLDDKRDEVKILTLHCLGSMGRVAKAATPKAKVLAKSGNARLATAAQAYLSLMQMQILLADYSDNRIAIYRADRVKVFEIEQIFGVWDAEFLANGNLLITEFSVNRVREITRKGRTVWEFEDLKNPYDADRLANGNTLIADTFGRRVVEVDKKGKIVWKYDKGIQPYDVERLANGNTLIADGNDDRVIEVSKKGEIVWSLGNLANLHDVDRLPNGNTLLTIRMLNLVREVDPKGKTVMEIKDLSAPSDADRLANGNTIVAENGMVRMFNKKGEQIWKLDTTWAVEVNVSK